MNSKSDELTRQAGECYKVIKASTNKDPAKRGTMWANVKDLVDIIETSTSDIETISRIQNTYRYSINPPSHIKEKMVDWYLSYLKRRDGSGFFATEDCVQDSKYSTNTATRNGRSLTPDFLRTIAIYYEIEKNCEIGKDKFRIMELGGGAGHLARTLKLMIPNSTYIGIDLPETLFFSYIFLRLNFPDAKTLFVTKPIQSIDSNLDKYDFVFVPTIFADELVGREADLFCNTASMGEMNNLAIRYWMDFIQNKVKVRYFYGLNRFLNPFSVPGMLSHDRLNENECSVLFDNKWEILKWEVEPPHSRCPYEEPSVVTRNLEIIVKRISLPTNVKQRSEELLIDLKDEDWFRHFSNNKNVAMRSNVLVNDLTKTGALFKLWESIRLDTNTTNVSMMLIYLHTLMHLDHPFEEWFYYKKLLGQFPNEQTKTIATKLSVWHNPYSVLSIPYFILKHLPMSVRYKAYKTISRMISG